MMADKHYYNYINKFQQTIVLTSDQDFVLRSFEVVLARERGIQESNVVEHRCDAYVSGMCTATDVCTAADVCTIP